MTRMSPHPAMTLLRYGSARDISGCAISSASPAPSTLWILGGAASECLREGLVGKIEHLVPGISAHPTLARHHHQIGSASWSARASDEHALSADQPQRSVGIREGRSDLAWNRAGAAARWAMVKASAISPSLAAHIPFAPPSTSIMSRRSSAAPLPPPPCGHPSRRRQPVGYDLPTWTFMVRSVAAARTAARSSSAGAASICG